MPDGVRERVVGVEYERVARARNRTQVGPRADVLELQLAVDWSKIAVVDAVLDEPAHSQAVPVTQLCDVCGGVGVVGRMDLHDHPLDLPLVQQRLESPKHFVLVALHVDLDELYALAVVRLEQRRKWADFYGRLDARFPRRERGRRVVTFGWPVEHRATIDRAGRHAQSTDVVEPIEPNVAQQLLEGSRGRLERVDMPRRTDDASGERRVVAALAPTSTKTSPCSSESTISAPTFHSQSPLEASSRPEWVGGSASNAHAADCGDDERRIHTPHERLGDVPIGEPAQPTGRQTTERGQDPCGQGRATSEPPTDGGQQSLLRMAQRSCPDPKPRANGHLPKTRLTPWPGTGFRRRS